MLTRLFAAEVRGDVGQLNACDKVPALPFLLLYELHIMQVWTSLLRPVTATAIVLARRQLPEQLWLGSLDAHYDRARPLIGMSVAGGKSGADMSPACELDTHLYQHLCPVLPSKM